MHFADVLRALRELAGVTEPGGHALMVEYSSPIERHPLEVSTNSFPVPEVPFSERSLQRVLFSKDVPVDEHCHDWKRCDHPRALRDKPPSKIEQGPTGIHRVAADGVGPARNECGGLLYVDIGSGSHRRCRDRNSSLEKNPSGTAV